MEPQAPQPGNARPRALGGEGSPPPGPREQHREAQDNTKIAGGYKLIPVRELAAVWYLQDTGQLRIADVRAYMACHEANARRCMVGLGTPAKFTLAEILRLTGGTERHLKASIARLEAGGVLTFTESAITFARELPASSLPPEKFAAYLGCFPNNKRLVPVPRRILRLMAGGARRSLIATIVGHLLWGLYRSAPGRSGAGKAGQGGFDPTGRVKCSWISETFGVDLRRVKAARRELIEMGWLVSQEATQWEHNRWGAKFRINLAWSRNVGEARAAEPAPVGRTELPPPPADFRSVLPPPVSNKQLPTGSKNQKPASGGPAGFQSPQTKTDRPQADEPPKVEPTLRNIVLEDLREPERLFELHAQAVDSGLVGSSESDRLKFFAAAEHARVIGTTNPCGLFARLVRSKLWHYLTQDDEDAANRRLKGFLFGGASRLAAALPSMPGIGGGVGQAVQRPVLSEDARFVRDVSNVLRQRGVPESSVWRLVNREKPEWTRERWDAARLELGRGSDERNQ